MPLKNLPRKKKSPFWTNVRKSENGCWIWIARRNSKGYGVFWHRAKSKNVLAHKFAYELRNGPVLDGFHIHHLCRERSCVNPWHMLLMNTNDHRKMHRSVSEKIRELHADGGISIRELAREFNVSQRAVERAIS